MLLFYCSIPESNFLRVFDVFLDLSHFAYFYAISIDFNAVKCLIYIFCVIFDLVTLTLKFDLLLKT